MVQYLNSRLLSAKALAALRCLRCIRDCASSASIAMGFDSSGTGRAAPRPRPLPRPRVGADLSLIVSFFVLCWYDPLSSKALSRPSVRIRGPWLGESCGRDGFFCVVC